MKHFYDSLAISWFITFALHDIQSWSSPYSHVEQYVRAFSITSQNSDPLFSIAKIQ